MKNSPRSLIGGLILEDHDYYFNILFNDHQIIEVGSHLFRNYLRFNLFPQMKFNQERKILERK